MDLSFSFVIHLAQFRGFPGFLKTSMLFHIDFWVKIWPKTHHYRFLAGKPPKMKQNEKLILISEKGHIYHKKKDRPLRSENRPLYLLPIHIYCARAVGLTVSQS